MELNCIFLLLLTEIQFGVRLCRVFVNLIFVFKTFNIFFLRDQSYSVLKIHEQQLKYINEQEEIEKQLMEIEEEEKKLKNLKQMA